jgi:hypothetical protein
VSVSVRWHHKQAQRLPLRRAGGQSRKEEHEDALLSTICCSCWSCALQKGVECTRYAAGGKGGVTETEQGETTHLQVVADHHLQHKEELSIRDESVTVHVVDLEGDCECAGKRWTPSRQYSYRKKRRKATRYNSHFNFSSLSPLLENALNPATNS